MQVKMTRSCRYADPGGPHLPQIDFVEGTVVDVSDALAASIIKNKHGKAVVDDVPESVEPESKDEGVTVESKDDAGLDGAETVEPESKDEKQPKRRGRPPKIQP